MALEIQQLDRTVEIFDNFYNQQLRVPSDEWDVIYSFFLGAQGKKTESAKKTAAQFATVLFRISQETGTSIMEFYDYLKGIGDNKLKLTGEMAFYLNLLRTKTALYGIANQPRPNQTVQRNVIL